MPAFLGPKAVTHLKNSLYYPLRALVNRMVTKQQHSLKSRPETQDPQSSTLKPRTLRIMSHDPGTWDSEIKDLGPWDPRLWDPGIGTLGYGTDTQDTGNGTLGP